MSDGLPPAERRELVIQKTMARGKTREQAEAAMASIAEAMRRHKLVPDPPRMTDEEFDATICLGFVDGTADNA